MKSYQKQGTLVTVLSGLILGCVLILMLSVLCGLMMVKNVLPETMGGAAGAACAVLGTALSTLLTAGRAKEKKLLLSMINGALIFLVMLLIHSLAFHGTAYQITAASAAIPIAALLTGLAVTLRKEKRRYV